MAGLSFLPSATPSAEDQSSANALAPGQSAISTIALNLPKILGARPLTNAGMLGGGTTGATHAGIDPQQIVLQALMRSAMSTPTTPMSAPPSAPSAPMGGGMSSASAGPDDEELRRRLAEAFGAPTPVNSPAPPAAMAPPIFTPGSNMHVNNAAPMLRPIDTAQTGNPVLRQRE